MNILLIEDDPTDLKLLCAVLQSGGHRVLGRISAEEALREIRRCLPEVILLDLKLPGMDGLALARSLKHNAITRHIPIIALTAAIEQFGREAALAAGCEAYIVKPVDTRRLSDQITTATARSH